MKVLQIKNIPVIILLSLFSLIVMWFTTTSSVEASTYKYPARPGDSLWKIAQYNGVTVNQLMEWNNLTDTMIYVGQELYVFDPNRSDSNSSNSNNSNTSNSATYTVKSGDSLWKISQKTGVSVQNLRSFNQLKSDIIYPNQVLKLKQQNNTGQTPSNLTNNIIKEAKKYIGVPYVWGGTSPSGFDCSGLLHYVYAKNGLTIPRTVKTIYNAGTHVNQPSIGDIVFFETYEKGPSHAGIYLGNGDFIHAGSSTGVTISNMNNNSYWTPKYLGAKRLHN